MSSDYAKETAFSQMRERGNTFPVSHDEIEQKIITIWQILLDVEHVGRDDNFFELGGDSFLLIQMIVQVEAEMRNEDIWLDLNHLFESNGGDGVEKVEWEPDFFDTPTVAWLVAQVATARRRERGLQPLPMTAIVRENELVLSFAQQRLWLLNQLEGDVSPYILPAAFYLQGKLDIVALERSFQEIICRHESLRTTFVTVGGQPRQVVMPMYAFSLPVIEFYNTPEEKREILLSQLIIEETQQAFDLANGPLFRIRLLRLDAETSILLLIMHHIITDGWSLGILCRELSLLYENNMRGETHLLPQLPIQYVDYAHWQHQWLQGEVLETQLSYWKQRLSGASHILDLPSDRPRMAVQTFDGAHHFFHLSSDLTAAIKEVSQREGVTLFMMLLAVFQILLLRYTGKEDICVGSPIANRTRKEIEGLIGFFANTVVLRTDFSGNPTFREVLRRVREMTLGAYVHQDLPFDRLVEELQPQRDLSHNPLFQVMFVLQNAPAEPLNLAGITVKPLKTDSKTSISELELSFWEDEDRLTGMFEYSTDLFDETTIIRMQRHLQVLLEAVIMDQTMRVMEIPILTKTELQEILEEWNDTKRSYPENKCIHQLFEEQVVRTPDSTALCFENLRLTYQELNVYANQLAHYLHSLGVGPDVLVGVYMERSLEMLIGLLGIQKAGGAYVPLDPTYPSERVAFILEDMIIGASTQQHILLTQSHLISQLPNHNTHVLCLEIENNGYDTMTSLHLIDNGHTTSGFLQETSNLTCMVTANNLSYVIYTSGSTGKPKGAMNTQRGICNRLLWMQDAYQLTSADAVLQKTPFSFDVSVWEFFWPLLTGARLVIARPEGHKDSAYLLSLIKQQQITTLHFVPSMLQVFLEEPNLEDCTSLRQVICSGELLSYDLQERFFARHPAALYNLYGPTEAAIDVTHWTCQRNSRSACVPIGYPIANTTIYILDQRCQPVPIGVPGELYIGGDGLARGYLNRPELTAERFIDDPFSSKAGARLYRTGDLARYMAGGAIEYLGRLDHQVKLRGYRIEPGEIESTLRLHPEVQETVIMVREDTPGHKQLVAYIIGRSGKIAQTDLRHFLQARLPDYMVPSVFIMLDTLPVTINGKLDRQALPIPDTTHYEGESLPLSPRSPIEEVLMNIWMEVFDLKLIGVFDNFFELGGDSLLAYQVIWRIGEVFNVTVPLQTLFKMPTIADIANVILQMTDQADDDGLAWTPEQL